MSIGHGPKGESGAKKILRREFEDSGSRFGHPLEQVITNLLTNAIGTTKLRVENRELKLHLFVEGNEVALRVSDNGSGIDTHT